MNQKKLLVVLTCLYFINISTACTTPVAGDRVWDVAATALDKIDTTESKVCEILSEINNDFAGTFTVAENILAKTCNNLTLVQQIDSSFDQLILNLPDTISKLCVIDSKVDVLATQIEDLQIDVSGTFTALDSLKTTICSKLEQVSDDLGQIETTITLLTQTEIDHALTIASNLSILQTDVDLLNSALDALTITVSVQELDSCVDILSSLVDDLDMDVCNLQSDISNGFAGTFTALDTQLSKACIIESLTDVAQPTVIVDLSGVFTALDALQQKVCNIESLVDIVCLINSRDIICSTDSKIDIALSKICLAEQEIALLPSLADVIISKLESVDMADLDVVCSNLEVSISILDIIGSKVDTIESKVCNIDLLNNTSKLQVIDNELITIESKLDTVDAMTSKLCVIDSKIDPLQQQALTIESIIDVINIEAQIVDSKIDGLNLTSKINLLESKLCEIEPTTRLIVSNLDLLLSSLQTSDSKLDIMIPLAESNIDQLLTIESRVEIIESKLDALPVTTIISKLCVIEDQVCTIESILDIIDPLIGTLNVKAQELIGDFQETWTILDVIENKLCTAEPILETITSKLDQDFSLDLSGVFTEIEAILQKECTIDSKVDITLSLVDLFVSEQDAIDFSGVFTALDTLLMKVCTVDSQTDVLGSKVEELIAFCGVPIYQSDIGTTGLTIDTPERYYLAEPIIYNPAATGTNAITIASNNVTLDLNGFSITQVNGTSGTGNTKGIVTNSGFSNIRIENGAVHNLTSKGISFNSNCSNILLSRLAVVDVGTVGGIGFAGDNGIDFDFGSSNIVIDSCIIIRSFDDAISSAGSIASKNRNIKINNCKASESNSGCFAIRSTDNAVVQNNLAFDARFSTIIFLQDSRNGSAINCKSDTVRTISTVADGGIYIVGSQGITVKNCVTISTGGFGIHMNDSSCIEVIGNTCTDSGFGISNRDGSQDNYIAFNSCIENGTNIDEEAGAGVNTYLGNFAFNSTAAGDPDNSNYDIDGGSNITRKFVTVAQDGSPSEFPTLWHNINMLP